MIVRIEPLPSFIAAPRFLVPIEATTIVTRGALHVDLKVNASHLTIDFSRTTQKAIGPFNISRATPEAACFVAVKHVFPDVLANSGVMRAISVESAPGSFLAAEWPSPVGAYTEVSLRVVDVISGALAKAIPDRLTGCAFNTVSSLVLSGLQGGQTFVAFLYFGGGLGGNRVGDGMAHSASALSNSHIASVEVLESRFPLRVRQWALAPDSGGDGEYRGGVGSIYEFEVRCSEAQAFFVGDRGVFAPYGIEGGAPGALGRVSFTLGGELHIPPLISKADRVVMGEGDRVVVVTPGGGGYGVGALRRACPDFCVRGIA